jgi:hypothetical protein
METVELASLEFVADVAGALEQAQVSIKVLTSVIREISTIIDWW